MIIAASWLASGLLLAAVQAASISPIEVHRIHEVRGNLPHGWSRHSDLDKASLLPIKIGLAQSNMDKLDEYLMSVSHPESDKYAQHWNAAMIRKTFAPSTDTVDAVSSWLLAHGIESERISRSSSLGWLEMHLTVEEAESLLKAEYALYQHESGVKQVACDKYHVPHELANHIDFITPTVHFDAKVGQPKEEKKAKRQAVAAHGNFPRPVSTVKQGAVYGQLQELFNELTNCTEYITPDCLRALYSIPPVVTNLQKNPFGIVEYTPEAYLGSDLDMFFSNFSKHQKQTRPIEDDIDGGYQQTIAEGFGYNGEPDLDLEYGMTLVNPIPVTLYQVGDIVEGASFDNFLDAIDASYCTFEGGDNPEFDPIYPDPYDTYPGAYEGPENCGGFAATKVISTSYGADEVNFTPAYEARQCQEYAKLGLMGVSVLYSSGDYGVAGNGGQCIDPATGELNDGNSGRFNPTFPGVCPYVTSVGATQVIPDANFLGDLATGVEPEQACETVIYSGGGFSDNFGIPSYQASAVANYFAFYDPPYTAAQYNNSRTSRGIPDVSANGANYVISVDGEFSLVFGTSASSPTFASILTIINEYRAAAGKKSVGFVNPTLYAHPYVLNDITLGSNQGCGTNGFEAVPGWDPVTGLGTPNTPKMLALFLSLP